MKLMTCFPTAETPTFETVTAHACRLLRSDKTFLTMLDLSDKYIGDEEGCRIGQALEGNTHLKILFLSSCHLGSRAIKSLCDSYHPSLSYLYLTNNMLGDDGAEYLAASLANQRCATLTLIRLNHNKIQNRGAVALADALRRNTTLTILELMNNFIGIQGMQAFAAMLPYNRTLHELQLAGNPGGHYTCDAFLEGMKCNGILRDLSVDGGLREIQFYLDMNRYCRQYIGNYNIPHWLWGKIFAKISTNPNLLYALISARPDVLMTAGSQRLL